MAEQKNQIQEATDLVLSSTQAIAKIAGSINSLADKVDKKELNKSKKAAPQIIDSVRQFILGVGGVATALQSSLSGRNSEEVRKLFIDATIYKLDGKEISKNDFSELEQKKVKNLAKETNMTLPQQICAIAGTLGAISNSFDTIANMETGRKALRKFKKNIFLLNVELSTMMSVMLQTFKDLNEDGKLKEVMMLLTSEPTKTIHMANGSHKNAKTGKEVDFSKDVTINGRKGLIDTILDVFKILEVMNQIQPVNLLKFNVKLHICMAQISGIISEVVKIGSDFNAKQFEKTSKIVAETSETIHKLPGLISVVQEMNNMRVVKTCFDGHKALLALCGGTLERKVFSDKEFHGFLNELFEAFGENGAIYKIYNSRKKIGNSIGEVKLIIKSLTGIVDGINTLAKETVTTSIIVIAAKVSLNITVGFIQDLIKVLQQIDSISADQQKDVSSKVKGITEQITDITDELIEVAERLKRFSVIMVPALIGAAVLPLFVRSLLFIVERTNKKVKLVDIKISAKVVEHISLIVEKLYKVAVSLAKIGLIILPALLGGALLGVLIKELSHISDVAAKCAIQSIKGIIATEILCKLADDMLGMVAKLALLGTVGAILLIPAAIGFGIFELLIKLLIRTTRSIERASIKSLPGIIAIALLEAVVLAMGALMVSIAITGAIVVKASKSALIGLAVTAVIILGMVGILTLLATTSPLIVLGGLALMLLSGAIFILNASITVLFVGMLLMSKLDKSIISSALANLWTAFMGDKDQPGLIGIFGKLSGHIFEMIGASIVATLMMTITSLTLVVAGELLLLSFIPIAKLEASKDTIDEVFDVIDYLLSRLINGPKEKESKPGKENKFKTFVTKVFKGLGGLVSSIFAISYLAMSVISVGCVLFIAGMLYIVQNIKLDKQKLSDSIDAIISSVNLIYEKIFSSSKEKENDGQSRWGKFEGLITRSISGVGSILSAAYAVGYLILSIATVSCVLFIASLLKTVTSLDFDGNAVAVAVGSICDSVTNISRILLGLDPKYKTDEPKENKGSVWSNVLDGLKSIGGATLDKITTAAGAFLSLGWVLQAVCVLGALSVVVDLANNISTKTVNSKKMMGNITSINEFVKAFNKSETENVNKEKINTINSIVKALHKLNDYTTDEKSVELHTKFVDDSVRYVQSINSIDVKKVKSVTDMFGKMVEFSESIDGNFEKLAEVLSGELLDVLGELNDTLSGSPKLIQTQQVEAPTRINQSISETANKNTGNDAIRNLQKTIEDLKTTVASLSSETFRVRPAEGAIFPVTP